MDTDGTNADSGIHSDEVSEVDDEQITASVIEGLNSEYNIIIDNVRNITCGINWRSKTSPEEQLIKSRGRKLSNGVRIQQDMTCPVAMATRKSPRKPPTSTDFATTYFKSPTPKKTPVKSSKVTPVKKPLSAQRKAFRKRLSLNSESPESEPVKRNRTQCGSKFR